MGTSKVTWHWGHQMGGPVGTSKVTWHWGRGRERELSMGSWTGFWLCDLWQLSPPP